MEYITATKVIIDYKLPLNEMVMDFYDKLKSITKGYASMEYELMGFEPGDLVKMDIMINQEPVDALSIIVHRAKANKRGAALASKLKELIPGSNTRSTSRPRSAPRSWPAKRWARSARTSPPSVTAATSVESASCSRSKKRQEADEVGRPGRRSAGSLPRHFARGRIVSVLTKRFWSEGPGSFALALGLALLVRWALLEAYVIPSGSMLPSLLINDHIFVNKIVYGVRAPFSERWLVRWAEPHRGDLVVFKFPGALEKYYIKAHRGRAGDRVLIENGRLYVNGRAIERTIPRALDDDGLWLRDADFPGEANSGGRALYVHWEERLDTKAYSVLSVARRPRRNVRTRHGPRRRLLRAR